MCSVCCAQELVPNQLSSQAQNLRTAAEAQGFEAALQGKDPELQQLKAENVRLARAETRARKEAAVRGNRRHTPDSAAHRQGRSATGCDSSCTM